MFRPILSAIYDQTEFVNFPLGVQKIKSFYKSRLASLTYFILGLIYLQKSGAKLEKKKGKFFFSNCSQKFFIFLYISEPSKTKISLQVRLSLHFYSYVYKKHHVTKNASYMRLSFFELPGLARTFIT